MVNPNIDIRNICNYSIHSITNFYLIISVVTDVDLVHPVVVEELLPILPGHKGRGVHSTPVANNETISFAGLGEFKERVLNLHHGLQKVFLKLILSINGEFCKIDTPAKKNSGSFWNPVNFPSKVFKEC